MLLTPLGLQYRFGGNWGQITWNLSGLSPKRDWSSEGLSQEDQPELASADYSKNAPHPSGVYRLQAREDPVESGQNHGLLKRLSTATVYVL